MDDQPLKVRIVGIGASAGGLDALKTFFREMPEDSGLAFVVIQHLDPHHESMMADLLAKCARMKVALAKDNIEVEANHIYTIPANKFLYVKDGVLHLTDTFKHNGSRMPIDFFFRSLALDQDASAIAVLFSGGGSDGTLGIREIHGVGGLVIAQTPESAQFDSMIESAIATGLVDYVLPIEEIPGKLLQYAKQAWLGHRTVPQTDNDCIEAILELLLSETKSDFRAYKKSTVRRRIERRMGINHLYDMPEYYRLLRENRDELQKLAKDMLIGVTSFFRDPDGFAELFDKVIKPLVQEHNSSEPIRAWIPGCATGEEAYSIVILLLEEIARAKKPEMLQVFASDIDRNALQRAREGIYPESISVDVSEERLSRFFVKKDGTYQVDKRVRDCVTFAEHDLVLDPPFMRMDLISCRNLLIYIEPSTQEKILNLFAFSLNPGGYLFLGKSDTTVEKSDMFETISRSWRMFRRQSSMAVSPARFPAGISNRQIRYDEPAPRRLGELNQQLLLQHFNAALVIVSEQGEILHFYGPTEKYLRHQLGDASLSLYEMIDVQHSLVLRLSVERASRENRQVNLQLQKYAAQNSEEKFEVTILPTVEPRSGKRLLGVIFESIREPLSVTATQPEPIEHEDLDIFSQLRAENERLKHDLQSAIESFQVTHEEFTSANEEVLSINEELQSANEELETSKEELQSVNEELITVNSQLSDKVEELTNANDDLSNLVNTSEVGTLFLDRACCIRRFTPSMTRILNLLELDVGRPISHIATRLIDVDLSAIAENVLKNLSSYEREVMAMDGLWYMLSCVPYRTQKDVIDGVVFNFTDVTRLKQSEEAMRQARTFAESIIETVGESLLVLDPELRIVSASDALYRTLQVAAGDVEGRVIDKLGNGQWNIPGLRESLEEVLKHGTTLKNFEVEHEFPSIGRKIMSLNGRRLSRSEGDKQQLMLLAIEDITEARQAEAERNWFEAQLRQAQKMESLGTLAAGIAHDVNNILNIIQGYACVLQNVDVDQPLVAESVPAILEATQRGALIVQQLLTLARKTEPKLELIKIESLLSEVVQLLRQTFSKTIEVNLDLSPKTWPVMADRNQMHQAFLNLCINARDAMPDGGVLTIKTSAVNRQSLANPGELQAEEFTCIEVRDSGVGIDENILGRIFEPFFTTKGTGRGTGLGLAVVYGIVKHHNGTIQVESKPSEGSTFRIYLPAVVKN